MYVNALYLIIESDRYVVCVLLENFSMNRIPLAAVNYFQTNINRNF